VSYYEYRHVIGFEETNVVGNVYYSNHIRWQGRCRELFLKEHAPELLVELSRGLSLATVRCSCDYFAELEAFDEIVVRMHLADLTHSRISLAYEYYRNRSGRDELVARGEQQIVCMRRVAGGLVPAEIPDPLRAVLHTYAASKERTS
jgi:enediyne core biosynthesis thioesterase